MLASAYICYEFLGFARAYIFTVTLTITRTLIVIRVFMGSVYNYTTLLFSVRVHVSPRTFASAFIVAGFTGGVYVYHFMYLEHSHG